MAGAGRGDLLHSRADYQPQRRKKELEVTDADRQLLAEMDALLDRAESLTEVERQRLNDLAGWNEAQMRAQGLDLGQLLSDLADIPEGI